MKFINFWLLDLWTRMIEGEAVVHLSGFLPNGQRVLLLDSNVKPFCVTRPQDFSEKRLSNSEKYEAVRKVKEVLVRAQTPPVKVKPIKKFYQGRNQDFVKVWGTNPSTDIKEYERLLVKAGWESHESDIYFTQIYTKERRMRPSAWNLIKGEIVRGSKLYEREDVFTILRFEKCEVDSGADPPKLVESAFDIEGDRPILTIFYECRGRLYRLRNKPKSDKGERKLLENFVTVFKKTTPDLFYQYAGNKYDWLKIIDAVEDHEMRFPLGIDGATPSVTEYETIMVRGRPTIDLYGYANYTSSKRKTLYMVHESLVKEGYIPKRKYMEINRNKVYELPWDEVSKHCACDVTCCMDIGRYALPFLMYLSSFTGIPIDQAGYISMNPHVESLMMRFAQARNELIPNRHFNEELAKYLKGAHVYVPKVWFAERVAVLDFSTQYPKIIDDNNIDYATFVAKPKGSLGKYHMIADEDAGVNYFFKKKPKGLLSETTHYVIENINLAKNLFKEKHDEKYAGGVQGAKLIGRCMYGYMKYYWARWGTLYGARATTAEGRNEVRGATDYVEDNYSKILDPIYGDTDSIFIETLSKKYFTQEFFLSLAEEISGVLGANLSVDKLYQRIFFCELAGGERLAKKKYIYVDIDGNVGMAGFEGKRGDWAPLASRVQWDIAKKLMLSKDIEVGVKSSISYANRVMRNLSKFPLESFVFTIGLGRLPSEYKVVNPHVAVAQRSNEFITEDGKVEYVIATEKAGRRVYGSKWRNILSHRALHPSELKSRDEIDYSYYRWNQIYTLADRVLRQFLLEYDVKESLEPDISDVKYYYA